MYHHQCDWCGGVIRTSSEQYVRARIDIVTGRKDYAKRDDNETEPSRFFHVAPRRSGDEWDRLGIEVRSEEIGDCCYTRALKAIEAQGFDEPDAGLEWRLVPVGARLSEKGELESPDGGAPWELEALWEASRHKGWLQEREKCSPALAVLTRWLCGTVSPNAYAERGIKTVGDLKRALEDGSISRVQGVGPKTADRVRAAFETFLAETMPEPAPQAKGKVHR